jgi:hypothetical protein
MWSWRPEGDAITLLVSGKDYEHGSKSKRTQGKKVNVFQISRHYVTCEMRHQAVASNYLSRIICSYA